MEGQVRIANVYSNYGNYDVKCTGWHVSQDGSNMLTLYKGEREKPVAQFISWSSVQWKDSVECTDEPRVETALGVRH